MKDRKKITAALIIFLMLLSLPLVALEKDQLARLHFDGGGDWYNNQDIIPNIVEVLNRELNTDFAAEEAVVKPSESRLFEFPFVLMTGHGNISFSDQEAENLRKWLLSGGFLYADDDYGMNEAFHREIKKVFPEKELQELPDDHPLFSAYYIMKGGAPKIHKHDNKRPQTFAIFDEDGRIMVLYTYEANITDGWSNAHNDSQEVRDTAFHMGINIFYYLFTRG